MVRAVFLAYGFRPFFLLTGLYAVVSMTAWLVVYAAGWSLPGQLGGALWHGHEMVFGFAVAAVAGFLLTAVPSWTDTPRVQGPALGGLVGAWVAGRLSVWLSGVLPAAVVAVADLAMIGLLAIAVTPPIVRARRPRNFAVPLLLLALFASNLAMHLQALGLTRGTARTGLYAGAYLVVLLVILVGGRITPAFTANALRKAGSQVTVTPSAPLAVVTLLAAAAALGMDALGADGPPVVIAAMVTALLITIRLVRWRGDRVLGQPILWVLHAGYAWTALGLVLLGLSHVTDRVGPTAALHALTAGAIGTMVLAVMSRAALGHTGRPLVTPKPVVGAYLLVMLGAVLRVGGPLLYRQAYASWMIASGLIWGLGFAIFLAVYAPFLLKPRVDGKPG